MNRSAVVFGATSYLGGFLLRELAKTGTRIFAVCRNSVTPQILLERDLANIRCGSTRDLSSWLATNGAPDAVVNLAYSRDASQDKVISENQKHICEVIDVARKAKTERIIHVSTQAVFGYRFEGAMKPGPVKLKFGDSYIETKIIAEKKLLKDAARDHSALSIVRLGNILGPGSPAWVARIAQSIIEAKPLAVANRLGPCNGTYVKNAANYLAFLVIQPPRTLIEFGVFHHLAEFSRWPWKAVFDAFADAIGTPYVVAPSIALDNDGGGLRELIAHIGRGGFGGRARYAMRLPFVRSIARPLLRAMKQVKLGQIEDHFGTDITPSDSDRALLTFFVEPNEFRSHCLPEWNPPVRFDQAMQEIGKWLKNALYAF